MEQIKKYIRGNKERGNEVIAELEKLGGVNQFNFKGVEEDKIYIIVTRKFNAVYCIDLESEKSLTGQLIVTHPDWEEIELPNYKYPKTYEECRKVLDIDRGFLLNMYGLDLWKGRLLGVLQILLICRDAYWKIAGEEMGLGKAWEPDWTIYEHKFCIGTNKNKVVKECLTTGNRILAFSAEKMRDVFYDNFKEIIEQCKELL